MADDRGPQLQGVIIFFLVTACIAVALRSYTRMFLTERRFGAEDGLMVSAVVGPHPKLEFRELTSLRRFSISPLQHHVWLGSITALEDTLLSSLIMKYLWR